METGKARPKIPAVPQLFFPSATEVLLRKQWRSADRSKPKASAKAQHSLGNQSRVCELLLLAGASLRSTVEETRMERNSLGPSIPSAGERSVFAFGKGP